MILLVVPCKIEHRHLKVPDGVQLVCLQDNDLWVRSIYESECPIVILFGTCGLLRESDSGSLYQSINVFDWLNERFIRFETININSLIVTTSVCSPYLVKDKISVDRIFKKIPVAYFVEMESIILHNICKAANKRLIHVRYPIDYCDKSLIDRRGLRFIARHIQHYRMQIKFQKELENYVQHQTFNK